ncbi:MAG: 2-succinyl-5-enolpyruvyl-6-hydroxy-3-cyclohexene-1-carboxylic-acid synthase [Candidatus Omnitrophica bacterium]|nr:2-succinyl-5-enolpyruvyl-6-hydroxy-3-cyclohexene-1-carboxylic-acid synthase [Candidatus Omnitrophota bacterium]
MADNLLKQPNINYLWSSLLVEELRRQGADHFFVAPGSRSAPIASAIGHNKKVRVFVHFDERALAFMACGYAASSGKPAVLICTSGTAAANFLPGIIEASKKKLPLIILTADRPPELQKTGAAQTIEQSGLYQAYVRWSFDMPCPSRDIPPQFVLTTAGHLISRARGELSGPVHLNMMFREPLSPAISNRGLSRYTALLTNWACSNNVYTHYYPKVSILTADTLSDISTRFGRIKNGIILAGKLSTSRDQKAVLTLAERLQFPVFADITSGLRLGNDHPNVITYYDQVLLNKKVLSSVDGVIHFGGRMTSKRCYDQLALCDLKEYVMALGHPLRSDPLHQVTARLTVTPALFIDSILPLIPQRSSSGLLLMLKRENSRWSNQLRKDDSRNDLSEPIIARRVSRLIPAGDGLFLSNSMPVRDMDMYASADGHPVVVGANRGASGIDGIIASAAGFAEGLGRTTTLMIGDLAFLYDLNALALLRSLDQRLIIVVMNNNGGGIFTHLPVAADHLIFDRFFKTPHGLSFAAAAALFKIRYAAPLSARSFELIYRQALKARRSSIIEIKVSPRK